MITGESALATGVRIEKSAPAPLKVALVGFGTVGSSVARILAQLGENSPLQLTHICNRRISEKRVDWVASDVVWTEDIEAVLASEADVFVELIGGVSPAREWVERAIARGKSVVTANKKLIAYHGPELSRLATVSGAALAYGASVAGGVPVLDALQEGLAGDNLRRVSGILNGTCNFILTKMENDGATFAEALAEAQAAGFAEADPTDDVDGYDARSKLVILSRVGLKAIIQPESIHCQSIRGVSAVDFLYAHDLKCTIRQISRAELVDGRAIASVQPALVPLDSPLAHITGSLNIVLSTGEFGGQTAFSGHGAGGHSTAVAVVSDLLAIARSKTGSQLLRSSEARELPVSADFQSPRYVRFTINDRPGLLAKIAQALADQGINIDAVLQRGGFEKKAVAFVMTLEACKDSQLEAALNEMRTFDFLLHKPFSMPILPKGLF